MIVNEIELEQQLKEAGNRLLNPPSSIDELLNMLDKLEVLLIYVEQAPSRSVQDALLPSMKALISNALMRNSDTDVKVSVASCLSEITRITAPDPPYNDDHMKEIFQLTVAAFEKLSHLSSRCYMKAVSILDTVAKVRSCLIMLDLELDELIVKMFQHFLKIMRPNHPRAVFLATEAIMTLIIDGSDDISMDLLAPLLASVRKENQNASPFAWKLGEKVITNCATKLKPYLKEAVHCEGRAFDEYAPIVASICQDESHTGDDVNGSRDRLEGLSPNAASPGDVLHAVNRIPESTTSIRNASTKNADNGINDNSTKNMEHCSLVQHSESTGAPGNADAEAKLEIEQGTVPRKRGWKPNSLMNPEEGYDHYWIPTGKKGAKIPRERKLPDKGIDLHLENPVSKKLSLSLVHVTKLVELTPETGGIIGSSTPSPDQSLPDGIHRRRGRPKKNASNMNQDADLTENKEEALAEYEVSLKRQSEGRSNKEVKQNKHSRVGIAAKTCKTSLPSAYLSSDEKDDVLNEPEEKPLHQSAQIGVRNIEKDSPVVQADIRKRSLVIGISNVGVTEESRIKKTKSSGGDGNYKEEMPKKNLKRKRTPRKEVLPETPDLDEQLIGSKVKVWWPKDKMFYEGVVGSYDRIKKKHKVMYADGDVEILNLKKERWELIGLPDKEQVTDIPKADCSSDKSGAASISKGKSRKFSSEIAGGALHDELAFVDKDIYSRSRPESVSEGEGKGKGKNSTKKLKIRSTMIDIKSEQTTLDNASPSDNGSPEGTASPKGHDVTKREGAEQPSRSEQQTELRSVDSAETS